MPGGAPVWKQVDGLHGLARLSFETAKVEIRPGSEADLAALVAVLGQRHWFTDRLARRHLPGVPQLTHLEGLGPLWSGVSALR
jgi:hypothetical protein